MKKRICSGLFALWLVFSLCLPVFAAGGTQQYIKDDAQLLSDGERERLEERAAEISAKYGCGIYIMTTDEYSADMYEYAKEIYRQYDLGWGEGRDGKLLIMSMYDRDYADIAYGDFGNYAFTDYAAEKLDDAFLDNFADDDWYGGFVDFLDTSEEILKMAKDGTPMERDTDPANQRTYPASLGIAALVVIPITLIVTLTSRGRLKKQVRTATTAQQYVKDTKIRIKKDQFTHTTQTRVKIKQETRSGGGGGTTIGSGGFSGTKGKF